MAALTRKVISKLTTVYNNINPSTLNGAIDIIVVQQEDGTLRCTPFHVRFGKLGVLHSFANKVYITINDVPVEDLYMQLGVAGEAVFIEENDATPTHQPVRLLEPSSSDEIISLNPDANSPKQLSSIDCSPQTVNKQLDENEPSKTYTTDEKYAYEKDSKPKISVDVLNSNTIISTRRRPKRRLFNNIDNLNKQASEADDQERFNQFSSLKRRSRARKRDSIPTIIQPNIESLTSASNKERFRTSIKLLRKRSASENDLFLCQFDPDLTPYAEKTNRFNSIDRPKTLELNVQNKTDENFTVQDHNNNDQQTSKLLSNPIIIETKYETAQAVDQSNELNNSILSKSAPSDTLNMGPSDDTADDFYSHGQYSSTGNYESALSTRPTSPKSDTEYELDKSSQQPQNDHWQWKWGELPEQRRGVFRYFFRSPKKNKPKEGMYLDEITNNPGVDPSLYLPQMKYQNPQRTTSDDDQESGTGNSIPQSPFREHEASCLLGDAQLSLCGNINKQYLINDEIFNVNLITYEAFVNNPSIINDPNLVVRMNGKYYNWSVAAALLVSTSIFHKPLPTETVEQLQEKHMAQTKPRASGGVWWFPFYGKNSDMQNEAPKVTTPITTTDVLATAAKSEIIATTLIRHDSSDGSKSQKNSKSDNDSEEDSEVRKLTAKIEQEKAQKQQQQSPSAHQTTLRKTMILSSDQLKRLNLKLGINKVEFSVTTALQGTTTVESNIFYFDHLTKFVISDIDGTITKSDVLGHIIPLVGGDWSHDGIAEFFNAIQENGYQFIYLSARAIGQSQITRNFLRNVRQKDWELPIGPLLVSPDTLLTALYREVIAKKPEDFKIECLKNIASLFPSKNPFYAGFGNRVNDQWAYTAVGIPMTRIYTINPSGEVVREKLSKVLSTSYRNLHEIVDLLFPPMDSFSASETYSVYTYWREEPAMDPYEEEMRTQLKEIAEKQKTSKSNTKNKGTSGSTATAPTTTITKPSGEKLLTIAQATENTVKRA